MVNKKTILKVFLVVVLVAVILISAVAIFKTTNEGNNKQVANATVELFDSQNSQNLNKSITNNLKQVPSITYFSDFEEEIKTTNPVLYNKCRLTHLQHIIQSTLLKDLSVYSAFGSRDGKLKDINSKLKTYSAKLAKTYEAVAFFNQDYVIETTSQSSKEAEILRVAELLNQQNKVLIEANNMLIDYVIQYGFSDTAVAKSDFRIVLASALTRQSEELQNQINKLFDENEMGSSIETVYSDTEYVLKAYAVADRNSFVYRTIDLIINETSLPTSESFIKFYNTTNLVDEMFKSDNITMFILKVDDTEIKQSLEQIWNFVVKLSAGGL